MVLLLLVHHLLQNGLKESISVIIYISFIKIFKYYDEFCRTLDECLQIKNSDIAQHLSLPPVKLHCSMLAEDAIRAAVMDYKKKSIKQQQNTIEIH